MTPARWNRRCRKGADLGEDSRPVPQGMESVRVDAQLGSRLGVKGTPTFYINGILIPRTLRPSYYDAAIAYLLEKSGA